MARKKIDYGIDLGTTNSAIARMENGRPIIKKSDTQKDTMPSCIHLNKKGVPITGDQAYSKLDSERKRAFAKNDHTLINTFEEFKRTMGTDKEYDCKNMGRSFSSKELSAEVLKTLKGYVRDEEINSIVITVPAKFQGYQDDATMKAAKLAGFQHCILLQEPIAASMAYGVDAQSIDGEWLVFDFGGGTFDAALMSASEGIMKVVDTEGDNHLGGKNIDLAIVDEIIMPYLEENYTLNDTLSDETRRSLLRNAVKRFAEEIKINLSPDDKNQYNLLTDEPIGEDDEGNEIEIDITVTKEQYEDVAKPLFQRAIDLSQKLLKNNNLTGSDLKTVLLIGGPTFSETLRNMIREQITEKVNISIDPMIAVAQGAALYATTKDIPDDIRVTDKSKIQLKLSYQPDTVETEEKVGVKVLRDQTEGEVPEKLFVELNRQDKGWASGKVELKGDAEILDILLEAGKSNGFEVVITDEKGTEYPCEPDSLSIIQGFKTASATLPFDLCIDVIIAGKQHLTDFKRLKKNQPLPAKCTDIYQTQNDIRPGRKTDQIRIPVYYGEAGTKAIYNDLRGEVIITGEDLRRMLPKGSDVEITIEIDESRMIKVSACFPYLDDEIIDNVIETDKRKAVSKDYLERELQKSQRLLKDIEEEYPELDLIKFEEIRSGLNNLEIQLYRGGDEADTRDEILNRMRGYLKNIDKLMSDSEWPKVMHELNEALEHLEDTIDQYGNENAKRLLDQFNANVKTAIEKQDIKLARDLDIKIRSIAFKIADDALGPAMEIGLIKGFDDNFDMHGWTNEIEAKRRINEAKGIIGSNRATKENLRPIVVQLFALLPPVEQGITDQLDDDVLIK